MLDNNNTFYYYSFLWQHCYFILTGFISLIKFILRYFDCFIASVNGISFVIHFLAISLLVHKNTTEAGKVADTSIGGPHPNNKCWQPDSSSFPLAYKYKQGTEFNLQFNQKQNKNRNNEKLKQENKSY
jgi:hypothetical protein